MNFATARPPAAAWPVVLPASLPAIAADPPAPLAFGRPGKMADR